MEAVDAIFLVLWIAFWVYWLAASASTKESTTSPTRAFVVRVVIIIVAFSVFRSRIFKGHDTSVHSPLLWGIGLAVFVLGLTLAIWARIYLGRNWGTPMAQKVDPELVTSGPYRYVRHPIYSGIMLAMVGTAIGVSIYWVVVVVLLGVYFVYAATVEERNMTRIFPDTYPAYKRSTKMLIPFVF